MNREANASSYPAKLVSLPGLAVTAILAIAVIALSRVFGTGNILREVVIEVVAGFGSTVLILAIFGLVFRTGLERLLRGAPGGESLAESANRLTELLQDLDRDDQIEGEPAEDARLDRIEEDVKSLTEDGMPRLREEIAELRRILTDPERGRDGGG